MNPPSPIVDRVRAIVADALYIDLEEVKAESMLVRDLGAESIDFLDVMFRLEKEFQINLPRGEIENQVRGGLSDAEYQVEGRLTEAALARLSSLLPEVAPEHIKAGLTVRDIPSLFTVLTFARMVETHLGAGTSRVAESLGANASAQV